MAFPYKTILCPVDFDDNSLTALDKAVQLAKHFDGKILLLHVLPIVITIGEIPPPRVMYEDQEKAARAKLEDISTVKLGGVERQSLLCVGDIISTILEVQEKYQPDLLVIATHGRKGLKRLVLGSVAEAVVRKATCPVLTIREDPQS